MIERDAPGIARADPGVGDAERFRAPRSRAGWPASRRGTLIINLPARQAAVRDGLAAIEPIVDHAIDVLRGTRPIRTAAVADA